LLLYPLLIILACPVEKNRKPKGGIMRERLDCAVFSTVCTQEWVSRWLGACSGGGRLQVRPLALAIEAGRPETCRLLADSAMALRRFDVCLLAISEQNLAWARTTLLAAQGSLQTPVLALVRHLKAAALNDLYALGLADFVRDPICAEELRVRIERLLDGPRYRLRGPVLPESLAEASRDYPPHEVETEDTLCASILDRSGLELDAFAVASASRCATSKESFRAAKSKVIERFERAYITAALGRYSGNIAMAARAAQKHRRAFWALMRKHQIDAAPYRTDPPPQ
jgi:DNA-binding NtrC family response regulator